MNRFKMETEETMHFDENLPDELLKKIDIVSSRDICNQFVKCKCLYR